MGNRIGKNRCTGSATHVRFGSQADICGAKGHVRFTPECVAKLFAALR
jgi:hypothetical protein